MYTLSLNEQEKNALLVLIDTAVKSSGLQSAEAGVFLARKISSAPFTPTKQSKKK